MIYNCNYVKSKWFRGSVDNSPVLDMSWIFLTIEARHWLENQFSVSAERTFHWFLSAILMLNFSTDSPSKRAWTLPGQGCREQHYFTYTHPAQPDFAFNCDRLLIETTVRKSLKNMCLKQKHNTFYKENIQTLFLTQ